MKQEIQEVEITSGKSTKSTTMGGTGETVLEIEKQTIKDREAKLKKELEEIHLR
jgi:50S ribosomal subunit-associated GTPase HflX